MSSEYRPSYLALYESGELAERVLALEKLLVSCTVCPLDCGNDRTRGELARCFSAALPVVSTDCESIMAAEGCGSRPICFRTSSWR